MVGHSSLRRAAFLRLTLRRTRGCQLSLTRLATRAI
nr:MAG TPA: hypothetical protein [Caudoviricetes sp.]